MRIYLDREHRCHVADPGGGIPVDLPFFEGKCRELIEGYGFLQRGETGTWKGKEYAGELLVPLRDLRELEKAQEQYRQLRKSYEEGVDSL